MVDLISAIDYEPSFLFIADVQTDVDAIAMGGFGHVFKGSYNGAEVALKEIYKGHQKEV